MSLLYHAYVYLEFLILACTIYILASLRIPEALPIKNRDHQLSGNHSGERECHIAPDWLLIYHVYDDELYLVRTGTHADLFSM